MNSKFKQWYLYLYLFLLIYIEFGYHMVVENQISGIARTIILFVSTTLIFVFSIKKISSFNILVFLLLILVLIFNYCFLSSSFGNYILLIIPIYIGFCVSVSVERNTFIGVFSDTIFFLSIFSLALYIVTIIAQPLINALPLIGYAYGAQIHDAFFSVAITNSEYTRNYGITWEPGAFSILLGLALYFELFCKEKYNYKRIVVFVIAVATTFSTLGYVFVGLLFLSVFLSTFDINKKYRKSNCIIFVILFIALIFVILPSDLKSLVFSKLDGIFNKDSSNLNFTTESRINAIKYPFEAFANSPLIGVGYDKFSEINKNLCNNVATNTIINWFALAGLPFGLPCTYFYIKTIFLDREKLSLNIVSTIILIIAFCLLISTESLLRISLIYILVFYSSSSGNWNLMMETVKNENSIYSWGL